MEIEILGLIHILVSLYVWNQDELRAAFTDCDE